MIRYRHGLLFAIVALSGCQTMSGLFQNRFASTPEYSTEEMLALSQPLSEATSPELGRAVTAEGRGGQNANPVSLASYSPASTPQQAGRTSGQSLVEAGQQAIRDAGPDNAAGLQQARQLFQQAIGIDATNADAHHGIAIVADLQKDWVTAEQHYKQALSGDPSNPSLLNDLGYSYLLQSRYHESQQYLNQAIQISPKHERAHLNLALLSLRRGNGPAARQTLAQIYSQQEIESNLTRLQQDLLKLNSGSAGNDAAMTAGLPQNDGNAVYPVSQAQPNDWNTNHPSGQNFGQPAMAGSAYGSNAPNHGAAQNFPAAGGIQHFTDAAGSMAIDPALRVSDSQPVSLYPPGVVREEVITGQSTQQNAGFSPGQSMPQNGAQPMAHAGYPNQQHGMLQHGNQQFGGQPAFQAFPAAHTNGMQMPGANDAANMMNQYPVANSQPAVNQFNPGFGGGMNSQNGFGSPAMGLNVGPGMPFPVGGATGMNSQQGQFNPQSQSMAQPLLNQYDPGAMGMQHSGFGQMNSGQMGHGQMGHGQMGHGQMGHGQVNHGQVNHGQANYGQANHGQLPSNPSAFGQSGQGQREVSQFPAHRKPSVEMQDGNQPVGQLNTLPVSYGQRVGAPSGFGQANYGQPVGSSNPMPGQYQGSFNAGGNQVGGNQAIGNQTGAMNGQPMYSNAQPQHFGQGMNQGMGGFPAGMPQGGMPKTGMSNGMHDPFNGGTQQGQQGGPLQQYEQKQMSRMNDQYQQALQQMNGRGFPGQ